MCLGEVQDFKWDRLDYVMPQNALLILLEDLNASSISLLRINPENGVLISKFSFCVEVSVSAD